MKILLDTRAVVKNKGKEFFSLVPVYEQDKSEISILEDPISSWKQYSEVEDYICDLFERMSSVLQQELNKIHGLELESVQWKIVYGHWLYTALFALYDRYIRVKKVSIIPEVSFYCTKDKYQLHRTTTEWLEEYMYSEGFNAYIFCEVCSWFGISVHSDMKCQYMLKLMSSIKETRIYHLLSYMKKYRCKVGINIPKVNKDAVVVLMKGRLPNKIEDKLKSYAEIDVLDTDEMIRSLDYYNLCILKKKRKNIKLDLFDEKNDFEKFCKYEISKIFPIDILEGFKDIYSQIEKMLIQSHPCKLYSSAFVGVYLFPSIYGAVLKGKGTKIIDIQHSAVYNVTHSIGTSEYLIFDEFLTWGWRLNNSKFGSKIRECCINRLPSNNGVYCYTGKKKILYLTNALEKYECGRGTKCREYFKNHFIFLDCLLPEYRENVVTRLRYCKGNPVNEYYKTDMALKTENSEDISLLESILESRILICDSYGSSHIEGMIIGVPVMFFGGVDFNRSNECMLWHERLKEYKVYAETPEDAANNLMSISNIDEWWRSTEVQGVVQGYLAFCAKGYESAEAMWTNELMGCLK